jgi:secreted trypsin-like serine protease
LEDFTLIEIFHLNSKHFKTFDFVLKGDSGSPVFQIVNGKAYLYGIQSSGNGICKLHPRNFAIVTNVNFFRLWIADNTK